MPLRQALVFPDAEDAWISYLNAILDVRVAGETLDAPSVRVRRVGGPQGMLLDNAMMVFECHGGDNGDAANLARQVSAIVFAAAGTTLNHGNVTTGPECKGITSVSGPASLPDPDTGGSRYTFTVMTALKGKTVASAEQLKGTPA